MTHRKPAARKSDKHCAIAKRLVTNKIDAIVGGVAKMKLETLIGIQSSRVALPVDQVISN
jgi:hypothetical protein